MVERGARISLEFTLPLRRNVDSRLGRMVKDSKRK
jgi:hypothetical protein